MSIGCVIKRYSFCEHTEQIKHHSFDQKDDGAYMLYADHEAEVKQYRDTIMTLGIDVTIRDAKIRDLKEKLSVAVEALKEIHGKCYDSHFLLFGKPAQDALEKIERAGQ